MSFLCADSGPWRKMSRAWPAMSAITTSPGSTCPSRQESAWGAGEARQEKVIVEVVRKGIVAGRCCSICWTHLQMFCQYCPRREGVRRGAVLSSRCLASWPSPTTTTLDRKRTSKRRHHVWSVERFALSFSFLRSVHGCMWMDVWVDIFTMPFLCADYRPWRKMCSRWPPISAKTTSGTTCPSHQDSGWRSAEARQERVIVEVVRQAIVVGKCCSMWWTHLEMFSVSTVLGEKACDVVQSRGASAELRDRRPTPYWTGQLNEGVMFGELRVLLFVLVVCMGVWEWLFEWMSLRCHSCVQTLDRGERCLGPDLQCPW